MSTEMQTIAHMPDHASDPAHTREHSQTQMQTIPHTHDLVIRHTPTYHVEQEDSHVEVEVSQP